jgi:hypothetical protein
MASPQMMDSGRAVPPAVVMTNRIIWAALLMGQLVFVAVIFVLHQQGTIHRAELPILVLVAVDASALFMGIGATLFVPRLMIDPDTDEQTFRGKYATAMLIPMAILEGASFAGLVFVMLTGQWWPLGVVPAISLLVQLTLFPRSVVKRRAFR